VIFILPYMKDAAEVLAQRLFAQDKIKTDMIEE
jgi:hypothetical protein